MLAFRHDRNVSPRHRYQHITRHTFLTPSSSLPPPRYHRDFANLSAKKIGVFTDSTIRHLTPMKQSIAALELAGVDYEVFDRTRVEPNDKSWADAISFARKNQFDGFLAVGGGSVMDTAKVANLFTCYPEAELLDFVNAPIGKGTPIGKQLRPLIAVPTTAGTGSETTGTAIFVRWAW